MPVISLQIIVAIACGGAIGAICRYLVSTYTFKYFQLGEIPVGTLAVNLIGAFLLGLLAAKFNQRVPVEDFWRPLLVTGFLGALTTFSSFSIEVLHLLESGQLLYAVTYVAASVVLCVAMVWLGMQVV